MEWYKSWFDSPYYHILYKDRDSKEAEKFINNLLTKYKFPLRAYFLDLACGKGRHAYFLYKNGYKVLGLDLSKENIAEALNMENNQLYFQVHDMREPYKSTELFDAVFNLFSSFGYFEQDEDNLKIFQNVHKQLKEKGIFFIDFMNSYKVIKNLIPNEYKTIEEIDFHISKQYINGRIIKDIKFADNDKSYHYQESVQALQFSDYKKLMDKAGFKLVNLYGSYDLEPYNEHTSDRLILVMQKI